MTGVQTCALPILLAAAATTAEGFAGVVAFNSLSKRSNLPGLRCGFAAGDADFLRGWVAFRNMAAPQVPTPCQAVAVAAYGDETHVVENRRLYDTEASRYVNLDDLAAMIASGADLTVVDARSSRDLTQEVLLQVIQEGEDARVLPVSLLRRIIRCRGEDAASRFRREQLALGLELLAGQLDQAEVVMERITEPALVVDSEPDAWQQALLTGEAADPAWKADPRGQEELVALRAQLERLEERLKR